MRAIQIVKPREIAMIDAPKPEPEEDEVIVQCSHVALCGSNMGQYTGVGLWGDIDFPNPVGWAGHENIGRVVASRLDEWKEGDLVLAQPQGYYGFAEFIRSKPPGIARLPSDAPDVAALIVAQPLATVLRALKIAGDPINETCAVIGAGPMGLIWTHALRRAGASRVIAIDLLEWRLEWAKRFGATDVIVAPKENEDEVVADAVRELTGGEMVDFCVEAVGMPDSLMTAARLPKPFGRMFVFGMPHYQKQEFPWYEVFRKGMTIFTCVGPECASFFQTAADMVVSGHADLGEMVTPRMPWDKAPEAFEMYAECAPGSLKLTLEL